MNGATTPFDGFARVEEQKEKKSVLEELAEVGTLVSVLENSRFTGGAADGGYSGRRLARAGEGKVFIGCLKLTKSEHFPAILLSATRDRRSSKSERERLQRFVAWFTVISRIFRYRTSKQE